MNKIFAAYLTAGESSLDNQISMIRSLIKAGVNLLEIGVPFSDPIADGPVIQRAMKRALDQNTTLQTVFDLVKAIKDEFEIPVIIFTYYNPILQAGEDIYRHFSQLGVRGILIVDLPFDEVPTLKDKIHQAGLSLIPVFTPSTPKSRIKQIDSECHDFVYYACQKGTTGTRDSLPPGFTNDLENIRSLTRLPILVGFGISRPKTSQAVIEKADGFVIGSHFIQAIESGISPEELFLMAREFAPRGVGI